jgi:hypothetical protein
MYTILPDFCVSEKLDVMSRKEYRLKVYRRENLKSHLDLECLTTSPEKNVFFFVRSNERGRWRNIHNKKLLNP